MIISGLRGRSLEMALAFKAFSEGETPNIKQALITVAESIVDLEEYRKYMVYFVFNVG
jgi:hypothetical protein